MKYIVKNNFPHTSSAINNNKMKALRSASINGFFVQIIHPQQHLVEFFFHCFLPPLDFILTCERPRPHFLKLSFNLSQPENFMKMYTINSYGSNNYLRKTIANYVKFIVALIIAVILYSPILHGLDTLPLYAPLSFGQHFFLLLLLNIDIKLSDYLVVPVTME